LQLESRLNKTLVSLAATALVSGLLAACATTTGGTASHSGKFFNRTATFAVCHQVGASCESDATTAAEIVAASLDGMTLVYSNSPKQEVGFVDIS
jgi:hypothetical protein